MHLKSDNLLDMLQWRSLPESGTSDKVAFTFLQDGEHVSDAVTFGKLESAARNVAAHLQKISMPGDRVILLYPPSIDFIIAFFACVYAGRIAVPAIPPSSSRHLKRFNLILDDCGATVALTTRAIKNRVFTSEIGNSNASLLNLVWLTIDALTDESLMWQRPHIQPNDIAFLQYTSGSTGSPKGVMISHQNLMVNAKYGQAALGAKCADVGVSWLPPYHDFGLIAGIIGSIYVGSHCVQMPPFIFLMQPYLWLKALSKYRARVTGAPNFAYELCARRITAKQKETIDLSALEIAVNGAEPIRPITLRRFTDAFAECNFRPSCFAPGYGLAESTLLVSINLSKKNEEGFPKTKWVTKTSLANNAIDFSASCDNATEFICVGPVLPEHEAMIVTPFDGSSRTTNQIGEIWVRGPSVAVGYWNRPEQTRETFTGRIVGQSENYLRTGDLGFIHDGDLYITGRIKEVMIFDGKNIYPQDVEATVEALDSAFRPLSCAAFAFEDETIAQLVLIQEIESEETPCLEGLESRIRAELVEQHGIMSVAAIILVKGGALPRTTSGKIQRVLCKEMFLANQFSPVWEWRSVKTERQMNHNNTPISEVERELLAIWEECIGPSRIGVDEDFLAVGGHSLLAVQVIGRVRLRFQVELPLQVLFEATTVRSLAKKIEEARGSLQTLNAAYKSIPLAPRDRPIPLSNAQQRLWFIDQLEGGNRCTYIIPLALRLKGRLHIWALEAAINEMIRRHEALRTVFDAVEGRPVQVIKPQLDLKVTVTDIHEQLDGKRDEAILQLIQQEAMVGFDLREGPLLRVGIIHVAEDDHVLLLTLHHIITDGWSIGVIIRELGTLYTAYSNGNVSPLLPLAIQYADFAHWQPTLLSNAQIVDELNWWREQIEGAPVLDLPIDYARPVIPSGRGGLVTQMFSETLCARIDSLCRSENSTRFMVLFAAFLVLLQRYSGQDDFCVGTPIANRIRPELEPLIGFFANTLVLRTELTGDPTFRDLIGRVRRKAQDAFAHQNIPFERLVDVLEGTRALSRTPLFQVMFVLQNSIGDLGMLPGIEYSPVLVDTGTAKFDLTLSIVPNGNSLYCLFEYNSDIFARDTIEAFAKHYLNLLDTLIAFPSEPISAPSLETEDRLGQQEICI